MKKVLLALMTVFLLGMASTFAQSSNEPIVIDKALIGHKYYHGDQLITRMSDMKAIVANDELAFKQVKKAGITSGISNVLACAGGFAMGWVSSCMSCPFRGCLSAIPMRSSCTPCP